MMIMRMFFQWVPHLIVANLFCQNWQGVNKGVPDVVRSLYADPSKIYAGLEIDQYSPLRWNGLKWDTIGNCYAYPIGEYQGKIIASTGCGISTWDGVGWTILDSTVGASGFYTNSNYLYVMGWFDTIGGIPASKIARYDGTAWSSIDTTNFKWGGPAKCAIIYQGDLYVGGNMYNWNGSVSRFAKWNGTTWQPVSNSQQIINSPVECFEIYNNELYVGLNTMGFAPSGLYKWDGNQWSIPGGGITGQNAAVYDMTVFNGELYAVGRIEYAGGIPAQWIAKWNGTNWCSLGDTISNVIIAIEVYKNELYIAGGFKTINSDTVNYIAKWIGGNFTDSCGNTSGILEFENKNRQLDIYPNPSNGIFTVQLPSEQKGFAEIEICNVLGEEIFSEKDANFQMTHQINLSAHPKGIYFVKVTTEKSIYTGKVIVE